MGYNVTPFGNTPTASLNSVAGKKILKKIILKSSKNTITKAQHFAAQVHQNTKQNGLRSVSVQLIIITRLKSAF
jgi:hypothetical protein